VTVLGDAHIALGDDITKRSTTSTAMAPEITPFVLTTALMLSIAVAILSHVAH
jgi:hypothetical protein